jgi:triacylglycerol esterase/lipase EstA (alpha/beta hydrolase family)
MKIRVTLIIVSILLFFCTPAYVEAQADGKKNTIVSKQNISDVSNKNLTNLSPLSIVEADTTALGNRKPLLLIHGIQLNGIPSEPDKTLWLNFYYYYYLDQSLKDKYKIYYVWYYSNLVSVADLGVDFRTELDKKAEFAGKQISIIAHSMGGLVSRAFMNVTVNGIRGGDRVEKLITLGTPHHGSPMANGSSRYSVLDPVMQIYVSIADQLYYSQNNPTTYQYNRSDLRWDNFDNLLNYTTYADEKNDWLSGTSMNNDRTYDNKIIAYAGSYDANDYNTTYSVTDQILAAMFSVKFSRTEITDGIVPYSSASFQGHTLRKDTRFMKGYNHSRLASGMVGLDPVLYGSLKTDLLDVNTNVSELQASVNLKAYPNPTTGKFDISEFDNSNNRFKIDIIDFQGKIIYSTAFDGCNNKISLDISAYPKGLYLIKLSNNKTTYLKKVIKE